MREVSLETLPNVKIRDPSHNKNLPINLFSLNIIGCKCVVTIVCFLEHHQKVCIFNCGILHLRKNKCILVCGGCEERQSVCYIYDIIIFPVGFSFVLSPFQYQNALQKAQMWYRLLWPIGTESSIKNLKIRALLLISNVFPVKT